MRLRCGQGASTKRNKKLHLGALMGKKMHAKSIPRQNYACNLRLNTDAKDAEKRTDALALGRRTSIHEISSSCNWDALFMIDSNWICTSLYMPPTTNLQRMIGKGTNGVLVYSSEKKRIRRLKGPSVLLTTERFLRPKMFSCLPKKKRHVEKMHACNSSLPAASDSFVFLYNYLITITMLVFGLCTPYYICKKFSVVAIYQTDKALG
jgi:hypothetical protein